MPTPQETFWQGEFGNQYVDRNKEHSTINHFAKILLGNRISISSAIEIGANIGINLDSLKAIYPDIETFGVEINAKAHSILSSKHSSVLGSIYDFSPTKQYELALSSGVMIHQSPDMLPIYYSKLYQCSSQYIIINEYFSPYPVEVEYRGNDEKLFKRDFAKEMWEQYPDLKLVDYGFFWSKDYFTKSDDSNWFLFKK